VNGGKGIFSRNKEKEESWLVEGDRDFVRDSEETGVLPKERNKQTKKKNNIITKRTRNTVSTKREQ